MQGADIHTGDLEEQPRDKGRRSGITATRRLIWCGCISMALVRLPC